LTAAGAGDWLWFGEGADFAPVSQVADGRRRHAARGDQLPYHAQRGSPPMMRTMTRPGCHDDQQQQQAGAAAVTSGDTARYWRQSSAGSDEPPLVYCQPRPQRHQYQLGTGLPPPRYPLPSQVPIPTRTHNTRGGSMGVTSIGGD